MLPIFKFLSLYQFLSIAQTLANRHNGVIEVESQPGETRFVLLLPIPANNQNKE